MIVCIRYLIVIDSFTLYGIVILLCTVSVRIMCDWYFTITYY